MTAHPKAASASVASTDMAREVRFAVVMYGGVSLAIYIHGVTQELLRLVRSTARTKPGYEGDVLLSWDKLQGSERIYRRLSHLAGGATETAAENQKDNVGSVRFVVDVLSGTSAGGINGVFLAKALANQQEMGSLQDLWLKDGAIESLLNDQASLQGMPVGMRRQQPPASLLNSQRMYRLLRNAVDAMERSRSSQRTPNSPYVDQLDLYITTTDIRGLLLPIRLSDKSIYERRYRNVFHLVYATAGATGDDRNDFVGDNNPFLAFAARCTSAFPFAFEPMQLADAEKPPAGVDWTKFYRAYLNPEDGIDFQSRSFGDGGYLDNKPFSYATAALQRHRADRPVARRLLYIEPSPEHPEWERPNPDKPNVIENASAALLSLPRCETIREDLERISERNRIIERVGRVISGVEGDVKVRYPAGRPEPESFDAWAAKDLDEMIRLKGVGYGGYHRLKISALVDELSSLIARVMEMDEREHSTTFRGIRELVRAWRDLTYIESRASARAGDRGKPTQNQLLLEFDLSYRLRRLNFLRTKVDELYALDDRASAILQGADQSLNVRGLSELERRQFRSTLVSIKRRFSDVYVELRACGRRLRAHGESSVLHPMIENIGLTRKQLHDLLDITEQTERERRAVTIVESRRAQFKELADKLAKQLRDPTIQAAAQCTEILGSAATDTNAAASARSCLRHYYEYYDDYDMIILPITYGTGVGEVCPVEVIRVSPDDARFLIDEQTACCRKLGGDSYGHFGGFLDPLWRENDMLWGRLDGAERIVCALLPGATKHQTQTREHLVAVAQAAIIAETLKDKGHEEACRILVEGLMRPQGGRPADEALRQFIEKLRHVQADADLDPESQSTLLRYLNVQELLDCYHRALREDRKPDPEPLLRAAARATTITGEMLDGLATTYRIAAKPAACVLLLGRWLWGLVEVASPRSIPNVLGRYWIRLLYLMEVLLVACGLAFERPAIRNFGCVALVATVAIDVLLALLTSWMQRGTRWRWFRHGAVGVLCGLSLTVAMLAVLEKDRFGGDLANWKRGISLDLPALWTLASTVVIGAAGIRVLCAIFSYWLGPRPILKLGWAWPLVRVIAGAVIALAVATLVVMATFEVAHMVGFWP